MPGKEAVVEVEKAVVPEPVTKEVPKCEDASKDVKGKKDEDSDTVKTTETAPVADSADPKPQDTEITSSVEPKTEKEEPSSDKAEKETAVESSNGNVGKHDANVVPQDANGGAKNVESVESTVGHPVEAKSSEVVPKSEPEAAKSPVIEATPAESTVSKSSEAAETKPMETDTKTTEAKPAEAVDTLDSEIKSSEATPAGEVEPMEDDSKSSEAAAKPLPADNEKIVVEKESKSGNPVTGSDEVTKKGAENEPEETKGSDTTSADSSTEKKPENPSSSESNTEEKPGSSSKPEVKPDLETQIAELKKQGLALYVKKDYCAAADSFGKVLEVQAPLYGEMSEKLAETYFLYGSAMYEYGKMESGVLGEKVKEKDEEGDDEEEGEGDEQMEVDEKEAEPSETAAEPTETAAENSAENRPSTPSGYGEEEEKEPAEVTITEDKEDDDDAFRVAWEMLELAKATFLKADNKKRLADTLVKLGEVGIEIENVDAVAEMEEGLKIRKEVYPANHRIISETHFNIGLAYAAFDKYDDAVQHFTSAKDCLEKRIEELTKSDTKEDKAEVEEMKSLLPEIQEKIDDTKESKADKEKLKEKIEGELLKKAEPATPFPAASEDKPVSNISHLVKRKRKVDEILPERAAKQSRQEVAASTTTEAKPSKPDSVEVTETEQKTDAKIDGKPETQAEEVKPEAKPEEKQDLKPEAKSEEKQDLKPEEKPEAKTEEKPEQKSEEKPKEVKDVPQSEENKPEEAENAAEPAKPEEAKPAETKTKSPEPEKMEE